MSKRAVSGEFGGLDAIEKAGLEAALNRCRALARQIDRKLRTNRPEHFIDELSLADVCSSLERAANVLRQKTQHSVKTPASVVKRSQARNHQRHR
jgi:hypothetical protein